MHERKRLINVEKRPTQKRRRTTEGFPKIILKKTYSSISLPSLITPSPRVGPRALSESLSSKRRLHRCQEGKRSGDDRTRHVTLIPLQSGVCTDFDIQGAEAWRRYNMSHSILPDFAWTTRYCQSTRFRLREVVSDGIVNGQRKRIRSRCWRSANS